MSREGSSLWMVGQGSSPRTQLSNCCFCTPGGWRIEKLPLSKLRYMQKSIKREFSDGRKFNTLLDDRMAGKVGPDDHPMMVLEVVEATGCFYSNNNRRLYVLKLFRSVTSMYVGARIPRMLVHRLGCQLHTARVRLRAIARSLRDPLREACVISRAGGAAFRASRSWGIQ